MNYISKLLMVFLSFSAQVIVNNVYAETTLSQQLVRCAAIGNEQDRLACYDSLAHKTSANKGHSLGYKFIQPPANFLDSHLVSRPWKAEYTLTVQSFVDLISHAVLEDKKHVTVQGWSRTGRDYVLHITMQAPVELHFQPREPGRDEISMSLLRDVRMDGYTLGADQFIITIAAMVPNKKAD